MKKPRNEVANKKQVKPIEALSVGDAEKPSVNTTLLVMDPP
ncbi:MAG: hypothetical protein ACTSP5_16670 [Candidatus Heimdallarchaeota archaeon]